VTVVVAGIAATAAWGQSTHSAVAWLDGVRVVESDTFLLARPNRLAVDARGHVFLLDAREGRVIELDRRGNLLRRLARLGAGSGELRQPAALTLSADTLLSARDGAQRGSLSWDLRSGRVTLADAVRRLDSV
jgi:hypothetical protein